jgi:hypothetical protein
VRPINAAINPRKKVQIDELNVFVAFFSNKYAENVHFSPHKTIPLHSNPLPPLFYSIISNRIRIAALLGCRFSSCRYFMMVERMFLECY